MKKIIVIVIIIALAVGAWFMLKGSNGAEIIGYKTAKVDKGTVIKTVSSSGVVQPLLQVQVGTQVNGPVKKLYADFNSKVKEGDIIAQIDPSSYEARVTQSKANLISAQANVKKVEANLTQMKKELERNKELTKRDLISQSDLDASVAAYESAMASLDVAKASVAQQQAALNDAQISLDYTTIKSPIDGVVISRNVDEGQTVVANLSVATLFVIANNLTKVQIQASVAESDIGKISLAQTVNFSVDAYPDLKFYGKVSQIRLSPSTVSNVVTYTVIINADNPGEKLLPGMTANLTFEVEKHENVLRIPNAALRFAPNDEERAKMGLVKPEAAAAAAVISDTAKTDQPVSDTATAGENHGRSRSGGEGQMGGMGRRGQGGEGMTGRMGRSREKREEVQTKQLYLRIEEGKFKQVEVKVGITDGSFTELLGGDIAEGQELVTGTLKKGEESMVNPFMPNFGGRGGPRGR